MLTSDSPSRNENDEPIDAAELARQQTEFEATRRLEHARMIEEALARWQATRSAKEAHAAFVASKTPRKRYIY